jgi:hypothetical protein
VQVTQSLQLALDAREEWEPTLAVSQMQRQKV